MTACTAAAMRHLIVGGLVALMSGALAAEAQPQEHPARQISDTAGPSGRSVTDLPDGRRLLAGGRSSGRIVNRFAIIDPGSGFTTATGRLVVARADHTATVLPDGSVLIAGGVGADGKPVMVAEGFDPATGRSVALPAPITPRARHTATVLTTGGVLFLGGAGASGPVANIEVWDPSTGEISVLPLEMYLAAGARHSATQGSDRSRLSHGVGTGDNSSRSYKNEIPCDGVVRSSHLEPVS